MKLKVDDEEVAGQLRAQLRHSLLARHQVHHRHGGDLQQAPHHDLLADVEENLGGGSDVERGTQRAARSMSSPQA